MNDNEDKIIVLNDENGEEVRFEFLDLVEYNGERYVVLTPEDEFEAAAQEVVILHVDHLNLDDPLDEDEAYSSVDDEQTLSAVFNVFKEKHKDDFDFVDDTKEDLIREIKDSQLKLLETVRDLHDRIADLGIRIGALRKQFPFTDEDLKCGIPDGISTAQNAIMLSAMELSTCSRKFFTAADKTAEDK